MASATSPLPLTVVALGGNALLPRGQTPTAAHQLEAVRAAAGSLAAIAAHTRLVITHGNGPQVGLLSLKEEAYRSTAPYPLDVLDAETSGQLGYLIELELANAVPGARTVAVLNRVLVDAGDPAFDDPTKFIGTTYTEQVAKDLAAERGWNVRADGEGWRRVVPSPEPRRIFQLGAVEQLVDGGFLVICVGGGGIPVVDTGRGHVGVEAVVDKDLSTALLAEGLGADLLILATDVDAAYLDWGGPEQRAIRETTPASLRARGFAGGSMGPKVEAACRFVEGTGGRAAIGALADLPGLVAGTAGTQVSKDAGAALLGEAGVEAELLRQ
ncbi:MAG: carbamate kinase [Solirubrobacteraceae bacterium]|nr:carbamate kinase [Solirubrobacteraceae bacterium]